MDRTPTSEKRQIRTADNAVRIPLRLFISLTATVLLLLAPTASADKTIAEAGEGVGQVKNPQGVAVDSETGRLYVADTDNNRIDAFDSSGVFEFAFGWGVADGKAEPQTCGPKATPPTAKCRKGLEGGGAGQFSRLGLDDIAVDNDPASPSHHDVYVLDGEVEYFQADGARVQKFDPEGNFLLTFGGGVVTGGAKGSGNLVNGSTEVTNVQTTAKQFEVSQTITGAGIPAETKILALGPGTITLSKAATVSGAGVALSVAEGPGNVPLNEVEVLVSRGGPPAVLFSTPDPSPTGQVAGQSLPENATGAELQEALESLPNLGPGNVEVIGEKVTGPNHEYTVEFKGPRFADTGVSLRGSGSGGREIFTVQNGGGGAEICTAAIATSCAGGVQAGGGGGHGRFARALALALGPGGVVYVVDCVMPGIDTNGLDDCENRLQTFGPSGTFLEELALPQSKLGPQGLAVDSGGAFYVSDSKAIRKYDPAGNLTGSLPVAEGALALAVDAADNLFAAEGDSGRAVIAEYDPAGNILRRFGYDLIKEQLPAGLAPYQSPSGDIYTAESAFAFEGVVHRSFPPAGPLVASRPCEPSTLGSAKATLFAEVNPEGKATTFHFEYISEADYDANGGSFSGSDPASKTPESESIGSDFLLHDAATLVGGLDPETEYRCRVVAKNADAPAGVTGPEGSFETKEGFEFGPIWASGVKEEEATVIVQGNPLGIPASGQVEYVDDASYQASGFAEALSAPSPEIDFGASETMQLRSVTLTGLAPGTLYHYRLRARNGTPPQGIICPEQKLECPQLERTFRTHQAGAELGDDRAWELVSPAQKNSAEVAVPNFAGGLIEDSTIRIQAGAASGEAITYTSFTSFGKAESAPGTSQYLSKRTASGWATENISPFGLQAFPLVPPYQGFSADLGTGAFKVREPALTPDCPEAYENLYLRYNESGAIECLTPEVPDFVPGSKVCFSYAGASADGTRAFFAATAIYAGAPTGTQNGFNLYEWSAAEGLKLISVLPAAQGGGPAPPEPKNSFGSAGDSSFCQVGQTNMRHVISADGSRAIWTYVPAASEEEKKEGKKPASQLLVRVNGTETLQLDAAAKSVNPKNSGNGLFWAASEQGSVVYFTSPNRLVSGSKAETGAPDLYRFQDGQPLVDLTKASLTGTPADVQGVLGASDDGAYVYFVAKGALSEAANAAGQKAVEGKYNLYLSHEGKTSFVATLSVEDNRDWETQPKGLTARVSPDGRHLAFVSIEAKALVGYDSTVAEGEHCRYALNQGLIGSPICPQAFLYDAEADALTCASCNPTGARPLGPALLPAWGNVYEGPRYLSDDGSRLFFETFDALSLADQNGKRDVYEFEVEGSGTCGSLNPAFDPGSGGCRFLISGGQSTDETFLVDASSDGRDVFFSTRGALVGWDTDQNYDVYDARAGGGFPEPAPAPTICQGEACKPPPSAPPPTSTPPSFEGPGNPAGKQPPKCRKGSLKKRGRCVPKPKKRKHGKSAHKRGARR
jgi:DNA-binding beta-propeller fold protein YncE